MGTLGSNKTVVFGLSGMFAFIIIYVAYLLFQAGFQAGISVALVSLITFVIVALIGSALVALLTKQKEGFFTFFPVLLTAQIIAALVVAIVLPLFGGLLG